MKIELLTLLLFFLYFASIDANQKKHEESSSKREPRFISFNTDDGKIDVDLDLSIPFISIPLGDKDDNKNGPRPLVNINAKSITVAGILAAITAFVIPILFKSPPQPQYRLDEEFSIWDAGQTLNELVLGNNYVTPCIQRAICGAVARVDRVKQPSGADKIIDGLVNLKWIKNLVNGTSIEAAIDMGHTSGGQCWNHFKECAMPPDVFDALFNELGLK